MHTKRKLSQLSGILLGTILAGTVGTAGASTLVSQVAVPGICIPQFAVPMPVFGPAGPIPRVDTAVHKAITVKMKEIDQTVLPPGPFACPDLGYDVTFGKTRVWAYEISDTLSNQLLSPANWPAVTVVAQRHTPTVVQYDNQLPKYNDNIIIDGVPTTALVQGLITVDKTLHWADPLNSPGMNPCMDNPSGPGCSDPFVGPPPATAHLHGGEVSSLYDGGPESWFTPDGKKGIGYASLYAVGAGKAVYLYTNKQEPGTLWFHDHALGATRTNVYGGMAAFYFLQDATTQPANLPAGAYEVEMAIQDRQFDTTGQLYFPDGSSTPPGLCGAGGPLDPCLNGPPNPNRHPFWIPEFIGDVAIVNGAPWPVLQVEPRRYRLHLLDGSNARFYNMRFYYETGTPPVQVPVPVYAVGADDNFLNKPAPLNTVFIAPGERVDVIVDFTGLDGKQILVSNDAPTPFPEGLSPITDQPQMGKIMRLDVVTPLVGTDTSCNPAVAGQCVRPKAMVRLTDGNGHLANGVKIDNVRRLVLKEFEDPITGTPVFVLVNNTYWDGKRSPSIAADFTDGISELPRQGSTELWEIVNLTTDAHPMHTHLVQFQILNREAYDFDGTLGIGPAGGYIAAWNGAFGSIPAPLLPGCVAGQFCPGYGPPLDYKTPIADPADPILVAIGKSAIGGNPPVGPYLTGAPTPPAAEESGWKDTAKALPRQVLRLVIRWTPTSIPVVANVTYAGRNLFPFDPTQGDGYVWHCHIIDHEDNEMMRPYKVRR